MEKLRELVAGHHVEVNSFGEADFGRIGGFDLIILSGGHTLPVIGNEDKFEKEIELIQNADIPILGICLGFELIAHAFGSTLRGLKNKEEGIVEIYPTMASPLFDGVESFQVYEKHRWVVDMIADELVELARSEDGIEMVRHNSATIYGFQFHPEMFVLETVGDEIFRNFIKEVEKE